MGGKTVDEELRNINRGARLRWASASKKLHQNPCVRFALMAGAEALYLSSSGLAGLTVCALIIFFALLLLGPYLTFTMLLYNLTPWSKSPPNPGVGFSLFVGSFFLFFAGYGLFLKYPQLKNMENLSKIELIPVVFQVGVYYAFLSFCSLLGSLVTFDFLVAFYWACFVVLHGFIEFYRMVRVIPWYYLLLFTLCVPVFAISLVVRVLVRHKLSSSAAAGAAFDCKNFSQKSGPRISLPV